MWPIVLVIFIWSVNKTRERKIVAQTLDFCLRKEWSIHPGSINPSVGKERPIIYSDSISVSSNNDNDHSLEFQAINNTRVRNLNDVKKTKLTRIRDKIKVNDIWTISPNTLHLFTWLFMIGMFFLLPLIKILQVMNYMIFNKLSIIYTPLCF